MNMKRISIYYFLFCLIASLTIISCSEEDTSLRERLDKLEESTINSVEGQKASINKTIVYLKSIESSLDDYSRQAVITLEDSLQAYVDNELSGDVDWYTASVATLAQYEKAVSQLVLLSVYMSELCSEYSDSVQALSIKIDNAILSMQEWVNTSLTNYYDIAQVDAKLAILYAQILTSDSTALAGINKLDLSLALLNSKVNDNDSVLNKKIGLLDSTTVTKITQLHEQLDSVKVELTQSYTEAISSAIETNNGIINTKIANEIATVNTRIDNEINAINLKIASLEGRISALEDRVNELSKQLGIFFSDNDVSCSPGDIVNIDYTLINATDTTAVYTLPSSGYKAKVTKKTKITGTISVTVPNPIEDGTVLIFVNNGDRTVTKSLNFISGTMSISADAIIVEADGGDVSVDLSTDLLYTVKIPQEANWIHYSSITTKSAMRNETINFTVDENVTPNTRLAVVELVNTSGLSIGSVTIRQSANIMQANEIWYTSTDGNTVIPYNENAFGANIVSNIYGKNKGVIIFDRDLQSVGYQAFYMVNNLKSISLPEKVSSVVEYAFGYCNSLVSVNLPEGLVSIDTQAFMSCRNLLTINIPDSLCTIGSWAFGHCEKLTCITIPSKITTIGSYAFSHCMGLTSLIIPDNVKTIGEGAFEYCANLLSINISIGVQKISQGAFMYCSELKTIILPSSLNSVGSIVFANCKKLSEIDISNVNNSSEWYSTFAGCTNLETVVLPSYGVYNSTFENCTNLKNVFIKGYPTGIYNNTFSNVFLNNITLIVPKGAKQFYENADVFKDFGTITESELYSIVPEVVDLGLSVKWSSYNLGACSMDCSGINLAWGELTSTTNHDWSYYKWGRATQNLSKYNYDNNYGVVDNKMVLETSDDAANSFLGGEWRIPTASEWSELLNDCTWTWSEVSGVNGYMVRSNINGYTEQSIFLPATGYYGSSLYQAGTNGYYWSSSLDDKQPYCAESLIFDSNNSSLSKGYRFEGYFIRPVCP